MLGFAIRTLEDTPILPAGVLNQHSPEPDVFRPDETVELVFEAVSVQDASYIWEVAQTKEQPSATYVARMIEIESGVTADDARSRRDTAVRRSAPEPTDELVRISSIVDRTAVLGVRFWDSVTGRAIGEGLRVTEATTGRRAIAAPATSTSSATFRGCGQRASGRGPDVLGLAARRRPDSRSRSPTVTGGSSRSASPPSCRGAACSCRPVSRRARPRASATASRCSPRQRGRFSRALPACGPICGTWCRMPRRPGRCWRSQASAPTYGPVSRTHADRWSSSVRIRSRAGRAPRPRREAPRSRSRAGRSGRRVRYSPATAASPVSRDPAIADAVRSPDLCAVLTQAAANAARQRLPYRRPARADARVRPRADLAQRRALRTSRPAHLKGRADARVPGPRCLCRRGFLSKQRDRGRRHDHDRLRRTDPLRAAL